MEYNTKSLMWCILSLYVYIQCIVCMNIIIMLFTIYVLVLYGILCACVFIYIYICRYEQKAVFAVVIPRIEYLKDCLIKKGLEVATCDDSTLCTLNEAIKMVSATLDVYVYISMLICMQCSYNLNLKKGLFLLPIITT